MPSTLNVTGAKPGAVAVTEKVPRPSRVLRAATRVAWPPATMGRVA